MMWKFVAKLAGVACAGFLSMTGSASAQSLSEANTPGFVGGYSRFGGYYDTFGDFGGHSNYLGYVRTEGYNQRTVTLVTVPLQKRSQKTAHKKVTIKHAVADDCGWLKRRARDTGSRKWQARYDTCRRIG